MNFVVDQFSSLKNWKMWVPFTWLLYVLKLRKNVLGVIWVFLGPIAFISLLSMIYSHVLKIDLETYVPHLTIGYIIWGVMAAIIQRATNSLSNFKLPLYQGGLSPTDVFILRNGNVFLDFLHHFLIILVVLFIFGVGVSFHSLIAVLGMVVIIFNSFWVSAVLGFVGARYKDVNELVAIILRVGFLVTPIVWVPNEGLKSAMIGQLVLLNPFYHFIEIVRAPLLGYSITNLTYAVVVITSVFGTLLASLIYNKYRNIVIQWL